MRATLTASSTRAASASARAARSAPIAASSWARLRPNRSSSHEPFSCAVAVVCFEPASGGGYRPFSVKRCHVRSSAPFSCGPSAAWAASTFAAARAARAAATRNVGEPAVARSIRSASDRVVEAAPPIGANGRDDAGRLGAERRRAPPASPCCRCRADWRSRRARGRRPTPSATMTVVIVRATAPAPTPGQPSQPFMRPSSSRPPRRWRPFVSACPSIATTRSSRSRPGAR